MRKLLVLIALAFSCIYCNAQANYIWESSAQYYKNVAVALDVDKYGNVYHTGYFYDSIDLDPSINESLFYSKGKADIYIAKYDSTGNYIWGVTFGGPHYDQGNAIICDDTGNVYVAGQYRDKVDFDPGPGIDTPLINHAKATDLFVIKFDSSGVFKWVNVAGDWGADIANFIALDRSGNIYISGTFQDTVDFDQGSNVSSLTNYGLHSCFIAKYDNNGSYINAFSIGGTGDEYAGPAGIMLDSLSNIYIPGGYRGTVDFDPSFNTLTLSNDPTIVNSFIAKYDSSGNNIWIKNIAGSQAGNIGNYLMNGALSKENLYLCGSFKETINFGGVTLTSSNAYDGYFVKYNLEGDCIYAKAISGTDNQSIWNISFDENKNIFMSGEFRGVADFDPNGTTYSLTAIGIYSDFLAKYDSLCNPLYVYDVHRIGINDLKVVQSDFFICGNFFDTSDFDFNSGIVNEYCPTNLTRLYIAKYYNDTGSIPAPPPLSIHNKTSNTLISVFPNPTKALLYVKTAERFSEINITDISGKILQSTTHNELSLESYPNGIYFINIHTSSGQYTQLILKE